MLFRWILASVLVVSLTSPALEAQPATAPTGCGSAAECAAKAEKVAQEFGPDFKVLEEFPPMFGDLDGDGQEDAVVVATGSPLGGQVDFEYKVLDPHNSYFGFGDPNVTATFAPT